MANKQELLHFLDRNVFNPILHASPDKYSGAEKKKLEDVQRKTRSEQDRFRAYGSAAEIVENFKRDLHSSAAKPVDKELEQLKLPTLPSVREEFLKVAGES